MTRVSVEPAGKRGGRRAQGQLRARQSGCRSESGSLGLRRLPIGPAPAEVMFDGIKILTAPGLVMTPVATTEALVEWAAGWIGSRSVRVADVGTGSGTVAVALALRAPTAEIWATDDSEPAVALARANVARHGLDERVEVLLGDLLDPVPGALDLVVANCVRRSRNVRPIDSRFFGHP
jgi:SAM-dependent methyltransferase